MSMDDMAFKLRAKALVENLHAALIIADSAINPSDRSGISLHEWNIRLKVATIEIHAARQKALEWLNKKGSHAQASKIPLGNAET